MSLKDVGYDPDSNTTTEAVKIAILVLLALLLALLLYPDARQDDEVAASDTPPAGGQMPSKIVLVRSDGTPVAVPISDTTEVIAMATWCGYSEGLKDLLNDAEAQPFVTGRDLVFIFERDEWGTVERHLRAAVLAGEMTETDVVPTLARMKLEAGNAPHQDPLFFRQIAGRILFWDKEHPINYSGTPQILYGPGPTFDSGAHYLLDRLGMPAELSKRLMAHYYDRVDDPTVQAGAGAVTRETARP